MAGWTRLELATFCVTVSLGLFDRWALNPLPSENVSTPFIQFRDFSQNSGFVYILSTSGDAVTTGPRLGL